MNTKYLQKVAADTIAVHMGRNYFNVPVNSYVYQSAKEHLQNKCDKVINLYERGLITQDEAFYELVKNI